MLITVAHANASQVLLATAGCRVVLLRVSGNELKVETVVTLDHEVSCIDVTPVRCLNSAEESLD